MTRSPPIRQIIPIFLWLKLTEICYGLSVALGWISVIALAFVAWIGMGTGIAYGSLDLTCSSETYIAALFSSTDCHDEIWFWWFLGSIIFGLLSFQIWCWREAFTDMWFDFTCWIEDNWQQATRIAKAREKGR